MKQKKEDPQDLIRDYNQKSILPRSPHAGKEPARLERLFSGRATGKTCCIMFDDGKPKVVGTPGIKIED